MGVGGVLSTRMMMYIDGGWIEVQEDEKMQCNAMMLGSGLVWGSEMEWDGAWPVALPCLAVCQVLWHFLSRDRRQECCCFHMHATTDSTTCWIPSNQFSAKKQDELAKCP